MYSEISVFIVSMIGKHVIEDLLYLCDPIQLLYAALSSNDECTLDMSEGYASRAGIFCCSNDICLNALACFDESSKHITQSKPRSLILSAIDIPINGNIKESNEGVLECVAKIVVDH